MTPSDPLPLVRPTDDIATALAIIDRSQRQIALVVDDEGRLIGTVTDGDVRRGLLAGLTLQTPVSTCMHTTPTVVSQQDTRQATLALMRKMGVRHAPVVDADGRVVSLCRLEDLLLAPPRDNEVVLMVGGLGSRLGELTRALPKPMLDMGGRPLLEHIIDTFKEQGFRRFWLAVNYKAEVIENHFGDGSGFDCEIRYLRETQRMGTAGALSLLPERPTKAIVVSNGDLLLRFDIGALVDAHERSGADATMAVREHDVQVPFGVVRLDGDRMVAIDEKPIYRHLICGGLYALSPSSLDHVPSQTFFDMPSLFETLLASGRNVETFRLDGYWLDIGHHADYVRAQTEFASVRLDDVT